MKKETVIVVSAGAAVGLAAIFLMLLGNPANMGFCIACFLRDIAGACGLHSAGELSGNCVLIKKAEHWPFWAARCGWFCVWAAAI